VFAVAELAEDNVGALVVLERETGLRTFVQSGVVLDANLTSDLLISVFQQSSPLHDGAVIIRRGKVAAAACFLPLTTNPELVSSLGTRHRAAIGITEESDCMAIVVSEVSGRISIASSGSIDQGVTLDRLRLRMIQHFGPVVSAPHGTPLAITGVGGEPIGDLAATSTSTSEGD
jgi:diadenylate cyclase